MITTALHLLVCIVLVGATIYWKIQVPEDESIYSRMAPYIICAGLVGAVIIFQYLKEFFVVYYSGATYEIDGVNRPNIAWIIVSMILILLPFVALIPYIGRHSAALIVVGVLALVPSLVDLAAYSKNQQKAEQGGAE